MGLFIEVGMLSQGAGFGYDIPQTLTDTIMDIRHYRVQQGRYDQP